LARTVQGITHTWQVSDNPIGSGDAGEVYSVVCQDQPNLTGVMKRPARIATAGTILRQAGQIAQEGLALSRLDGLPNSKASTPRLLDQAPDFTQGTANYFIISETALGEDLDSILSQTRKTGKPFPRRVIMTVLDALFDMFSRAHKAGVLWNDVKLDHIYWHNPTGQVGVIDWGNALFLDSHAQHALPRWEDYQQMIETLGTFLQRSAPELYVDLGWEEFQGQSLDSTQVSILARRITYQQQVIAHQVMEYQSLMRVVLKAEPSLEGLRKIQGYKQTLEKIGAPWEQADVLKYCQSLVETALAEGNRQSCVRTTTLVWEIFDESLDLPWHLMREYCRHTDILTHTAFTSLANNTLKTNWKGALWAACTIANQSHEPVWWDRLIPVMRQKALGTTTPPPIQTCQTLLKWAQDNQEKDLAQKLERILQGWRHKGTDLAESPFDYGLLEIIRHEENLPPRLRSQIKQSFTPGDEAIRELVKVWTNANWEALPQAFQRIISWDPDRWGILQLSTQIEVFHTWRQALFEGPGVGSTVRTFWEHALTSRPKIDRLLGSPPWMSALKNMLDHVLQGAPIAAFQAEASLYCPWLLEFPDIHTADARLPDPDKAAVIAHLAHFSGHLQNWSDVDAGLKHIHEQAPLVYSRCSRLADGFNQILSLNANLDQLAVTAAESVPPELVDSTQVLQALIAWRAHLSNGDLSEAIQSLTGAPMDDWILAVHARKVTSDWHNFNLPFVDAIQAFTRPPDLQDPPSDPQIKQLHHISLACAALPSLWAQIDDSGIHANLLDTLVDRIEEARSAIIKWRVALEGSSDLIARLVYHSQLGRVRHVSNRLLRMAQHIRQARLAFNSMIQGNQTTLTVQLKHIENILDHLTVLEAEFVANPNERHYPSFQTAFRGIIDAQTAESRQAAISALPENHPFYAWLVKSTLAQDSFYS
jgi:hypothetical protein